MLAWCGCGPGRLGGPGEGRRRAGGLARRALGRGCVPGPLGGSWMLAWCGCGPGRLGGPGGRGRGASSRGRSALGRGGGRGTGGGSWLLGWWGGGRGRVGAPARGAGGRSLGRSALGRGGVPGPLGGSWMLAWCGCGPGRLGGPGARRRGARSLGRSAVRMKIVVQKFGGSSLATPELREIAASRVLAVRDAGNAPVVVCSAMGRAPDPYATDTLLGLLGPALPGPNRDLLLACGELISCAVFAELLTSLGAPAQAMTGGQAGILTDSTHGDAKILSVDPRNLLDAIEQGIIPVVAGFQGVTRSNAISTLGRGGSDLTAIALGEALKSESVEIYTDVSGVMTADPKRIAGAHTIDRVHYAEMVELAGNGAKVMHAKAAELARATNTPYVVKGLRSNVGTIIDDATDADAEQPVTGLTVLRDITFFRIIQGEAGPERADLDLKIFERMAQSRISIDMINVNNAGVFFVCDSENVEAAKRELADLNVAVRVRPQCAKISIVGAGMRGTKGVMYRVVRAITEAGVEIIHSTDSNITISILVPEEGATRAGQAIYDFFKLGRKESAVAS